MLVKIAARGSLTIFPMERVAREKFWRTALSIFCAISLLISALEFYMIKRLEEPKPKVHALREIRKVRVETHGSP